MFIKDEASDESCIHVCLGKTEKQMRNKRIEMRLHDVTVFTVVYDKHGVCELDVIDYCPYCGCNLLKDAFPEGS